MKSKRILAMLLTLSMGASVALVGCGKSNAPAAENSTGMDKEQYLNVALQAEPKSLDGAKSSDSYSSEVLSQVMEGLTRIEQDKDGKDIIVPAGAEKWESNKDGTVWTFNLRDYKWSDGKPVTAKDFVYGITRTLAKETGSTYAFLLYPIKNAEEFNNGKVKAEDLGVKAKDDKTLEFTLKSPCAYFEQLSYFKVMYPQRQDIVEKSGDRFGTESDTLVFCGPFVIKSWAHQSKIELEKNPTYWDAKSVKLEKITMKIIKDQGARMNELYNGAIDTTPVRKPEWIKKLDQTDKYNVINGYSASTSYEFFNQKDKYFKNAKIRKAFILAKDREGTVKTLFKNLAEPAYALCPPKVQVGGEEFRIKSGINPIQKLKDENKDPKQLLIEGLKEIGVDANPAKMEVIYLQSGTTAEDREFAEFDQQSYNKILGVNMKIEYVEWPVFQKRTEQGEYQMAGMAWTGDYNDPMTFLDMWMSNAKIVPTGWASAKYDNLIKKAQVEVNSKVRFEAFKEAENILLYEDGVISPGVYKLKKTYRAKFVKDISSPLFGSGPNYKHAYTQGRK